MLYNSFYFLDFITRNKYILILIIISHVESINADSSQSSTYTLIEYPEIKYCFSSMDLLDGSQSSNYFILKRDLGKNCTHVYGNIVISNIVKGVNGSEPDLRFLSSIREITGSLKIQNSNLSNIPLSNLRVIRGNSKLYNHDLLEGLRNSLEINWDRTLTPAQSVDLTIDLRSLRSIVNGNIKISSIFCKNLANIDWDELLEDPTRQSIVGKCSVSSFSCSNNCPIKKDKRYCWGPQQSQCQIFSKCKKRMCANRCFLSKSGDEECCNSQCLGGCTSSTADSCIACQGVLDGKLCQPECPPKKILNRESGIPVENKLFRPLFVNICLNKCPDGLLEQEGECKSQCTFRKYERIGNQCVPCKKFCEQICTVEDVFTDNDIKYTLFSMDAVKIKKLANCTTFKGSIHIDKETFALESSDKVPITDPRDLWYLNNLRNISGNIYIDLKEAKFKLDNLSFLSNLQIIEGHHMDAPVSLGIYNTNISFLGLTSLKTIGLKGLENKPIVLRNNMNLCYFELEKFRKVLNVNNIVSIIELPSPKWCKDQGRVCSEECDPSLGCWGPGPTQCIRCQNVKLGKSCAKNCLSEPGYLPDPVNKGCLKCHEECASTCSGVNPYQCIGGCKHAMENSKCVPQCSRIHYLNNVTKQCEPCHPDCHPRNLTRLPICTGPSAKPGPGGCNKCQSLILGISGANVEPERCFNGPSLSGYFSENHPNRGVSQFSKYTEKFTDLIVTYRPCHTLCSKCTFVADQRIRALITDWNGCTQCKGYWYENKCVAKCPFNLTYLRADRTNSSLGNCLLCNRQCNGCYGEGNDKCIRCNTFVLSNEKNSSQFSCVENCPPNYVQVKSNGYPGETKCEYVLLTQLEFILVILAIIFFLFLLIFVSIITKIFHLRKAKRRKEKLVAFFSNANENDSHNINTQPSPPNMNHLLVISSDDLDCFFGGEILGKGTFGSVYAGKWKPNANFFDDSGSMNSCRDKKVDVVIKVLNGSCDQNEFMEEVRIMASVRHKHCLRLIGVSFKGNQKLLISSFVPHGSMDKYLVNFKKTLTGHTLLLWAEQIANGMFYLELNHIIHRDLATRNVLIYKESHVQITDFGLSKVIKPKDEEIQIFGGMVPVRWLAIETLREGIYSHKTDVWAYAVTLWEIFTFAKVPYETIKAHEIRDEIIKGTRLCQPEICSLDIYILMLKCWSADPVERPTFEYLWSEFKMYSNNSQTYLSHPNVGIQYKDDTANNYIDVIHNDDDRLSNNSMQSGKALWSSMNESMRLRASPTIIIPENIRPLLSEQPRRNILYEPANQSKSSNINLNGSFSKNNGNSNFHDYNRRADLSSSSSSYLEPLTTRI